MAFIYEIRNVVTDRSYIGSTKQNPDQRWSEHLYSLRHGKHSSRYLQNSFDKHGESVFEFIILEKVDDDNRFSVEKEWLDDVKPFPWGEKGGYNMTSKAGGGDKFSLLSEKEKKEFIKKSKKVGEENGMYNSHHSQKSKEKMKDEAEDRYTIEWFQEKYGKEEGRKRYRERCKKLSAERKGEDNPFYGEKHDEKSKEKISEKMNKLAEDEEWRKRVSEGRKGTNTGSDNPNYVHVPKEELKEKIKEGLVSKELANHFDTSQNTITRKVKKYWGEGLRSVRSRVS